MKTRYRFEGPTSGLQLEDKTSIRLTAGAELELDSDDARVARLVARGHLIEVAKPAPEKAAKGKNDEPPPSGRKPGIAKGEPATTSNDGKGN